MVLVIGCVKSKCGTLQPQVARTVRTGKPGLRSQGSRIKSSGSQPFISVEGQEVEGQICSDFTAL